MLIILPFFSFPAAVNWPDHRGTATAFPMAGFGLSAFLFSAFSSLFFADNTASFLLLLTIGTSVSVFVSYFFLAIVPHAALYAALPTRENEHPPGADALARAKPDHEESGLLEHADGDIGNDGAGELRGGRALSSGVRARSTSQNRADGLSRDDPSQPFQACELHPQQPSTGDGDNQRHSAHSLDVRGTAVLKKLEFWQLFVLLGTLGGVGLMTIKSVLLSSPLFYCAKLSFHFLFFFFREIC